MGQSYYELLGVAPDASDEEIERAYRERLKETHPDVSDDEDASERTRRLIEARDILTDEAERARYDRLGHDAFVEERSQSGAGSSPTERGAGRTTGGTSGTASGGTAPGESRSTTSSDTTTGSTAGGANSSEYGTATSGASGTTGTAASGGTAAGTSGTATGDSGKAAGNGRAANRSGRNRRGNHAREDSWYGSSRGAGTDVDGTDDWEVWNTEASFAVNRDGDRYQHGRMFDDQRALILLATTFVVYPVLLFGALVPQFPVAVNLTVAICVVLVIAFLQSVPEVGIAVFGIWSLLLPLTMVWAGVDFASLRAFFAIVAVVFPFGLSVLTRVAIRPVSAG